MPSGKKIAVQLRKSLSARLKKSSMTLWQQEIERKWIIGEEGNLPYTLRSANLGVAYAQQTGRLTGETERALKQFTFKQYTDLLGEMAAKNLTQADIPRFLNKKYGAMMKTEAKNLSPEVEKKIDKIEADIKSGKLSDKEGRKKIGDLMSAANKVSESIIDAHLAGESAEEIMEKISGYDPRWGNTYPYAPVVHKNEPGYHGLGDEYNYPLRHTKDFPRTGHETHVADGHEAEADEYMKTGEKR